MADTKMEKTLKMVLTGVALGLLAIWLANNVREIAELVRPRTQQITS